MFQINENFWILLKKFLITIKLPFLLSFIKLRMTRNYPFMNSNNKSITATKVMETKVKSAICPAHNIPFVVLYPLFTSQRPIFQGKKLVRRTSIHGPRAKGSPCHVMAKRLTTASFY